MVYSAKSDSTTISQFTRRKKIHINSSSDGALTDYQVKLEISYESAMQPDFDDIRFNETDGSYINYWIESKTDSTTATIWIKTNVPASGGKDIYIYYGNSSLSNNSDGRNTFIVYDRYENVTEQWTELDPNDKYVIDRTTDHRVEITNFCNVDANTYIYLDKGADIGNFIYKASFELTAMDNMGTIIPMGVSNTIGTPFRHWNFGFFLFYYVSSGNGVWFLRVCEGTYCGASTVSHTLAYNTIYYIDVIRNGDEFTLNMYSDYARTNLLATTSRTRPNLVDLRYVYVTGQRYNNADTYYSSGNISESIIANYTPNIPTTSIGTEQHQRRTPQFV